ncbi:hypothetical protein MTBPR1_30042 [Candidatus Terasakiella magnetica]|uniref:Uncharacterized protein n=1 Tax=Candidatus Terasakiella magnetica TaxID=1867952 RepID=A0A1C3RHI5_9PROT|nr:hypothetical protein MTBPR1_30042 [Candidatus Terasakiella magnetica]
MSNLGKSTYVLRHTFQKVFYFQGGKWCPIPDLNQGHADFQYHFLSAHSGT